MTYDCPHLLLLLEVFVHGVQPVLLGPGGAAPHPLVHVGDGSDGHLHRVIVSNLQWSDLICLGFPYSG